VDSLAFALVTSIFLNLILLRWAVSEHQDRRKWEKEAAVLEKILRDHPSTAEKGQGKSALAIWLTIGLFLAFTFIALVNGP
jgi:hypothetical protein